MDAGKYIGFLSLNMALQSGSSRTASYYENASKRKLSEENTNRTPYQAVAHP